MRVPGLFLLYLFIVYFLGKGTLNLIGHYLYPTIAKLDWVTEGKGYLTMEAQESKGLELLSPWKAMDKVWVTAGPWAFKGMETLFKRAELSPQGTMEKHRTWIEK